MENLTAAEQLLDTNPHISVQRNPEGAVNITDTAAHFEISTARLDLPYYDATTADVLVSAVPIDATAHDAHLTIHICSETGRIQFANGNLDLMPQLPGILASAMTGLEIFQLANNTPGSVNPRVAERVRDNVSETQANLGFLLSDGSPRTIRGTLARVQQSLNVQ